MAVKARTTVTLASIRDVSSTTRYYLLQSSTAQAPSKPTANPPGGSWTRTEPSYTTGSTNSLYFTDLTVFTDGDFAYSDVCLSSSYEAAKAAYNKAVEASEAATAASAAIDQATEVIVGTQTATTATWTGTSSKLSVLTDGTSITYWLPRTSAANVTLNLTLADGTKTGAKNVYYNGATRLGTQYAAGNIIRLTYKENIPINGSGSYTGWWCDSNYDSGNTYDRVRYQQAIKAGATAIVAANLIVAAAGNAGTYTHLKLGNPFDVTYPILYAGSAIAAASTGTNNYVAIPFTVTTTQAITLTAYKAVYIKGSLSGSTFTPVSAAPLTQAIPASADGYHYLLLGTAYSATAMYLLSDHPIFQFYNGAFKSTTQIAVEAAVAAAQAQEDADAVAQDLAAFMSASEIIVGTQTAVTGSWTGVAGFNELKDGQQIAYWLPYNGSGNATLDLTLKDGGTTGAIPVYYRGASRATTHFVAGTVIHLTYRVNANVAGTAYTGWWADASYDSGNTYNKLRFEQSIKAKTAISASRFIVGDTGGFFHLVAGSKFDITKPILWAVSAIAAGATGTNNLLAAQSLTLRNNLGGISLTQYETCYLVGTLSGKNFTVRSSNFFTSTVPTSDDGYYYISLGYLASAYQIYLYPEHPIYKFVNGAFMSLDQVAYEAQTNVDSLEQTFTETKAEIKQMTDAISLEVSKKVGNTEIISKINQSAEAVTIDAAKVGLTAGTLAINVGTLKVQGNDIPTSITNAGKTAKNHLYYSSAKGLVVAGSAPASDSAVNSMTSYNSRVTSTGFDVYKNGSTRVAHFGEETTVGQEGSSQQVIDSTSLKFNASNGQTNLLIDNNISGHGTVRERYLEVSEDRTYNNANGTLNKSTLATLVHDIVSAKVLHSDEADYVVGATSSTVTMKVKLRGYAMADGAATIEYSYEDEVGTTVSLSDGHLTVQAAATAVSYWDDLVNGFADRFPSGSTDYWIWIDFEIVYPVTGVAMTVGSRDPESEAGAGSVSMGRNNVASGTCSVALGKDLRVIDDYSVAVGEANHDIENANTGEHMETAFAVGAAGTTPFAVLKNGTIIMSSAISGRTITYTVPAGEKQEVEVTFQNEMPCTPFILLTPCTNGAVNNAANKASMGKVQLYLSFASTTGFTVFIINSGDRTHNVSFTWLAICTYG